MTLPPSGSRTRLGYAAVIAFYSALWLFGWIETVWCLLMLPLMLVLLRAESAGTDTEESRLTSDATHRRGW